MDNNKDYLIRKHKLSGRWNFDIENENLVYSDCSPTHHGLQCNFVGGTPQYDKIMSLCEKLSKIIKEIDEINNS